MNCKICGGELKEYEACDDRVEWVERFYECSECGATHTRRTVYQPQSSLVDTDELELDETVGNNLLRLRAAEIRVFDNGGVSIDRYTVLLPDKTYVAMSDKPRHPQGFCEHGDGMILSRLEEQGQGAFSVGKEIAVDDLPVECRNVVLHDLDCLEEEHELDEFDERLGEMKYRLLEVLTKVQPLLREFVDWHHRLMKGCSVEFEAVTEEVEEVLKEVHGEAWWRDELVG